MAELRPAMARALAVLRRPAVGWSGVAVVWVLAAGAVVLAFGRVDRSLAAPAVSPSGSTSSNRPPAVRNGGSTPPGTAPASGPGYLTIVIGRTEWVATAGCRPLPGAVSLDRVAAALADRGLVASGGVVPTVVADEERSCDDGFALRSSWADLAALRDMRGWSFFPRSPGPLDGLPADEQRAQTCGARDLLVGKGHPSAGGLFAYANNAKDPGVQADLVQACFAYGRGYGSGVNRRGAMAHPWWQSTRSVNGGRCGVPDAACAAEGLAKTTYDSPTQLLAVVRPAPDTWSTIQFYRFVEGRNGSIDGASSSGPPAWDCDGADPAAHWTNRAELYCFADFLAVLDAVGPDAVVADAATVAAAWGRTP